MNKSKINAFEIVLLIVGITVTILGFQLINQVYASDNQIGWLMVISIFSWLTLLVLFISLSLAVDVTKKQLLELKEIKELLGQKKGKKL